ncbi:alcohol dehydrogenase catalytic domain-containing protein [Variovorax sp. GT1P44]|uniref:alcohol dehydrogenase catalytic domain-containing protein n=1 Tax=Variovorax sp. GT1P44 TaxID=3443742 RepID=UPI003F47F745
MKAIRYYRYGEPASVLESTTVADPPFPAAGQVLIRVSKRPVHPGDLLGIRGRYRGPTDRSDVALGGATPGFEGAGTIEAIGTDVEEQRGLAVGARVMFFPDRAAWSERALVAAEYVTLIPDDISDSIASQLHVTPLTAVLLLRAASEVGVQGPGQGALVLTAGGSAVARLLAILARSRGIHVVSVVRRRGGAEALRNRLTGVPIVTTDDENWKQQLTAALDGQPIRAVVDPVGGLIPSEIASMLANGGAVISYGDLSGEPISLSALSFSTRGISIRGVSVGGWGGLPEPQRRADVSIALDLARTDPSQFDVEAEYPFAAVSEAALHAERAAKSGAVLLIS